MCFSFFICILIHSFCLFLFWIGLKSVMLMNRTTNVTVDAVFIYHCRCLSCCIHGMQSNGLSLCVCVCVSAYLSSIFLVLCNRHAFACLIDQTSSCYFMIFETHTHTQSDGSIFDLLSRTYRLDLCILPENKTQTYVCFYLIYDLVRSFLSILLPFFFPYALSFETIARRHLQPHRNSVDYTKWILLVEKYKSKFFDDFFLANFAFFSRSNSHFRLSSRRITMNRDRVY